MEINGDAISATVQEYKATKVFKSVDPSIDVGNLLIEDLDPFDIDQFKAKNDDYLSSLSRDNVQYLMNKIWELPTERVEDAIVVKLPESTSRLPREKPIPKIRPTTKWEKFANLKGIRNQKKSRMVWEEESKSWKPRWGYGRANDNTADWLVEIPRQKDQFHDYIGERLEQKKERVAKNELQRLRNIRNQENKADETVGMAVESKSSEQLSRQVNRAYKSTASIGKFTEQLRNEKPPKNSGKKRKFLPNESAGGAEKSKQLEILKRLESKKPKLDMEKAVSRHIQEEQGKPNEYKSTVNHKRSRGKNRRSNAGGKGSKKFQNNNKKRNSGAKTGDRKSVV